YGEEIRRLFDPADDPGRRRIPLAELVVYNAEKHVSQLKFQARTLPVERDEFSLVVYIDGACRGNGTRNARSSYGVYFGPDSPYNANGLIDNAAPQTSTRAEIEALAEALKIIQAVCATDFKLQQITIATDSSYLVDAMSKHVGGWIERGGLGSRGKAVAHYDRLKALHELLDEMEYGDDGGIVVQFWRIERSMSSAADALANA
ncbi:ribonuclease H-like protein, partial [Didymella exigua CBS 183.55]